MAAACALAIFSGRIILNFAILENLRIFQNCLFTGGVQADTPLSHGLRRASSPKGTPLRYAASFSATAKSRPLGEGGIAVGDDGRGNFRASSFEL